MVTTRLQIFALCLASAMGCDIDERDDPADRPIRSHTVEMIYGQVVDRLTHQPIPHAHIRFMAAARGTTADEAGGFALRAPLGLRRLTVEATGYGQLGHIVDHSRSSELVVLRMWPRALSDESFDWWLERQGHAAMDSDDLDDPDLTPAARSYLRQRRAGPASEIAASPSSTDAPLAGVPWSQIGQGLDVPPETIRIYRRHEEDGNADRSCERQVDVLPLEDYVKGVLPHEWYPSWHVESLKAGAVVIRSYAWGWIIRGGKYDCADLDDTARSQVYRDDRDARASAAVDATRGEAVERDGEVVQSEYSAENGDPTEFGVDEPLCTGRERRGHGRGLCQWGSQRWATERGESYDWMVEHYYPGARLGRARAPQASVQITQALARLDPVSCADPAGTYDCADFVREGRSRDLFDLYVGDRVTWRISVRNVGDGATPRGPDDRSVTLAVTLPDGLLEADAYTIETDAPGHGGDRFVPAQPRGDNPPADRPGGPRIVLHLHSIAAGETRRVVFTLRGTGYSVPTGDAARVRTWIQEIAELYDKPTWEAQPISNQGQDFNGGDLRLLTEYDIFRPDAWTWEGGDPALLEGWTAYGEAEALRVDTQLGALGFDLPARSETPSGVASPHTHIEADHLDAARLTFEGPADGQLQWRHSGEAFDPQRSAGFSTGGGAVEVELRGAPGWNGRIEQIRLEIRGDGGSEHRNVRIDSLELISSDGSQPPPRPDATPSTRDAWIVPTDASGGGRADTNPPPRPDARRDADGPGPDPTPPGTSRDAEVSDGPGLTRGSGATGRVDHQGQGCRHLPGSQPAAWPVWVSVLALVLRRGRRVN